MHPDLEAWIIAAGLALVIAVLYWLLDKDDGGHVV